LRHLRRRHASGAQQAFLPGDYNTDTTPARLYALLTPASADIILNADALSSDEIGGRDRFLEIRGRGNGRGKRPAMA